MFLLPPDDIRFPPVEFASPEGLLAVGGDLSAERLIEAYRHGIFPWYSAGQPILWWSPDPRMVLIPDRLKVSRSLRKRLRHGDYTVRSDTHFREVMHGCAVPRRDAHGTWITPEMVEAYVRLHELGYAHSVEAWRGTELVGGLYGVALGRVFFGESMFSRAPDASKVALVYLVRQLARWGYQMIDCQVASAHLAGLGAENIRRSEFLARLDEALRQSDQRGQWRLDPDLVLF